MRHPRWYQHRVRRAALGAIPDRLLLEPRRDRMGRGAGRPIDRHHIERFLDGHRASIRGRVLEVGADAYTRRFGSPDSVDVLDLEPRPGVSIVADLEVGAGIADGSFDAIICTQVLQYLRSPVTGIATIRRLLAPGGILLLSAPALSPIDDEYDVAWRWTFTAAGIEELLHHHFDPDGVDVHQHGNRAQLRWFVDGRVTSEVPTHLLDFDDDRYPVVVTAVARA